MAKAINIVISGNSAPLRKSLDETDDLFKKSFGGIEKVALASAAAIAGAGALAFSAIQDAADLGETLSKVGVLFGDNAKEIEKFADNAARSLGLTKQAALDGAATFATFGRSAGLTGKDLSGFSTEFLSLAGDLASFNNTTPQQAIDAIGSALRGEAEPLRKFGVLLDDATLRQKALELGIVSTTKDALTPQQKVLAAQAAIFEQTGAAQGDFARTSDSLSNKQKILTAEFANVKTEIGRALVPAFTVLVDIVSDKILPAFKAFSDFVGGFGATIKKDGVSNAIGGAFDNAVSYLQDVALPAISEALSKVGAALIAWIGPRIGPMLAALGKFIAEAATFLIEVAFPKLQDKLIELGSALVDWIEPRIPDLLKNLGTFLAATVVYLVTVVAPKLSETAVKLALALTGWVVQIAPEVLKGLGLMALEIIKIIPVLAGQLGGKFLDLGLTLGKSIGNGIIEGVNRALDAIANLAVGPVGRALLPNINIPNIPKLAQGGIVTGGATLAMIGEQGPEAVIPLNRLGNMGKSYSITVQTGVGDPREIGRQVVDAIKQYERTAGPVFQAA
jgi:hypothetical protein